MRRVEEDEAHGTPSFCGEPATLAVNVTEVPEVTGLADDHRVSDLVAAIRRFIDGLTTVASRSAGRRPQTRSCPTPHVKGTSDDDTRVFRSG
jgi:hypothetical protein